MFEYKLLVSRRSMKCGIGCSNVEKRQEFVKLVNDHCLDGWKPQGGISVNYYGNYAFTQAMIREVKTPEANLQLEAKLKEAEAKLEKAEARLEAEKAALQLSEAQGSEAQAKKRKVEPELSEPELSEPEASEGQAKKRKVAEPAVFDDIEKFAAEAPKKTYYEASSLISGGDGGGYGQYAAEIYARRMFKPCGVNVKTISANTLKPDSPSMDKYKFDFLVAYENIAVNVTVLFEFDLADDETMTLMVQCTSASEARVISRLINKDVKLDDRCTTTFTMCRPTTADVFEAAEKGNINDIRHFIANGANVNTPTKNGRTPVYFAAQNGHVHCIEVLVANGADVNTPNKWGQTPVSAAEEYRHGDCVKILRQHGADV